MNYFFNKDYPNIIRTYKIISLKPEFKKFLRKDYILGQWNFDPVYNSIKTKEKVAVITGFSASGKLHLGNKLSLDAAFDLKKTGCKIFIPLSDTEAILTRKTPKNIKKDFEEFKKDLSRWNLKIKDAEIYLHSSNKKVNTLFSVITKKLKFQDFKKIYGSNIDLPGVLALSNMLADIFYPHQEGYDKILVILGVDEIKHAKLAILASKKLGFPKPSFLFLKILNGLRNEKMSKSKPQQNILLSDSAKEVRDKIKSVQIKTQDIIDNPLYQIALWILDIEKEKLEKMSKELKYKEFVFILSKKIEEKYKNLEHGKNKNSLR